MELRGSRAKVAMPSRVVLAAVALVFSQRLSTGECDPVERPLPSSPAARQPHNEAQCEPSIIVAAAWSAQRDSELSGQDAAAGSLDSVIHGNVIHEDADKADKLEDMWAPPTPGPYFDMDGRTNVTALLGKAAFLNCRVRRLGNRTVSWVRHRDTHLLTVGLYTYTNDQRFRAQHTAGDDWVLQLKYPQHRDAGTYECQVSTTPHMSRLVSLTVVEPSSEILGGPDLYIDRGSTINLTCIVLNSPEPPAYVIWNHNDAIISYDSPRGGVSVVTEKGVTTESFLLIQSARPTDSGRYTCNPSNAQAKGINVHVLNGEHPAAMQHAGQGHHQSSHLWCLALGACLLLLPPLSPRALWTPSTLFRGCPQEFTGVPSRDPNGGVLKSPCS